MSQPHQHSKISPKHLSLKAIVYVRQSSPKQVDRNLESQRLQYAMAERAGSLGFTQVETIDCDLGKSASLGAADRSGFDHIISSVAKGEVGMVLSREVSRLSRTNKDWCQLFEVCQIFNTLIADEEQVYDLNLLDDQLVLGIKGTMSVVELKILQMRMLRGQQVWQIPTQAFVRDVLVNPFYAGAYVWGRRPVETVLVNGHLKKRQGRLRRPQECGVFIPDHHEGYITWQTYEENQKIIRGNNMNLETSESIAAARDGTGLLTGLLRCGHCGRKLHVRYWGGRGEDDRRETLNRQLQQLEFNAQRAFEQYNEVDPRNRLVAAELERRWNAKLDEIEHATTALARHASKGRT